MNLTVHDPLLATDSTRRALLRNAVLLGAGAAFAPQFAWAKGLPAPADLLPRTIAVIERYVGGRKIPGIVAAFGHGNQPTQFISRGTDGFKALAPVDPDSLFRIYSMTKPLTGMAAMILIDQGEMQLDQPLADILPAFANMQVQDVPDGPLAPTHAAKSPITIRNLLTHTAGLGYSIIQKGPIKNAYVANGLVPGQFSRTPVPGLDRGKAVGSLAAFADGLAKMPLVYDPGTQWSYSVGLDLMGRVIEVVSGKPFDQFLHEAIIGPVGMDSTWFQVPGSQAYRLTDNHIAAFGSLVVIDPGMSSIYLDKPPFPFGGAGLVSSARDYDRFLAMLANYGRSGRHRVMSERAVRMGTSNLLPPGAATAGTMINGNAFGAGGRVGLGKEAGTYGWGGAAGTIAQVDLGRGLRNTLMVQLMPPEGLPFLAEYRAAMLADLAAAHLNT